MIIFKQYFQNLYKTTKTKNDEKISEWPNKPDYVQPPAKRMPEFKQYYPSINDMNSKQLKFYRYWRNEWQKKKPKQADISYIFTYVYEVLDRGIHQKKDFQETLLELNALIGCYPGKIGNYVADWMTDLLEFHGYYTEALNRLIQNEDTWKSLHQLNRLLNLKILVGLPMDGKDLFYFGKNLGVKIPTMTQRHLQEAYDCCQEALFRFQQNEGEEFLFYLTHRFDYEKRHTETVFCGAPFIKKEVSKTGYVTIEFEGPTSINTPHKSFRFDEISFVVDFVVEKVDKVNKEIKYKYQKTKKSKNIIKPSKQSLETIWEVKIKEPFKNPSPSIPLGVCSHEYLQLQNHWETYRKYECIKCQNIFMCDCERELVEKTRPYQIKGTWLKGICPKCRGLSDTSPVTSGKLMYGSTFYAQYWREIDFKRDKMAIEIAEKEGKKPSEVSFSLIKNYEPENRVRKRHGIPPVGEQWISETLLFKNLKNIFPDYQVVHHAKPKWLGMMHLDIFIPELKIAFEYQGRQHTEPIEYFGGKEGFERIQSRDKEKSQLCKINNVILFYIYEGQDFSEEILRKLLKECLEK